MSEGKKSITEKRVEIAKLLQKNLQKDLQILKEQEQKVIADLNKPDKPVNPMSISDMVKLKQTDTVRYEKELTNLKDRVYKNS